MDIQDMQGKKASGIRSSEKTIGLLRRFLPVLQRRALGYARLKRDDTEENDIGGDDEEGKEDEEGDIKIKRHPCKRGINMNLRRKRYPFKNIVVKKTKRKNLEIKKKKTTNKSSQIKKLSKGKPKAKARICKKALVLRDPIDRWSTTKRYKMAEKNLLVVMKSMKATSETPMLRPQLRSEARKKIGDTRLPTKDHICARELKILKEAINKMERDFNETKVKLEEEVERLRREVGELSAFKKRMEEENKQSITIAASSDLGSALVLPVEKYEEQQFVKEMEEVPPNASSSPCYEANRSVMMGLGSREGSASSDSNPIDWPSSI